MLLMRDISKRFGATQALRGVSLEVQPGEVLALIGENGAGKSTLMKILSGAIAPDSGSMEFGGAAFQPAGPADARTAGLGIVYQELNLAPDLTVEDNIMLGRENSRLGLLDRAAHRRQVQEALAWLGHAELRADAPVHTLSTGLKQLVEIARALAQDARLIVFDEPTSSLAGRDVEHLFGVIRRLKQRGLAIIYISHFLEEVRAIGDRYAVLRDGRNVGAGRLADVSESQIVSLMVGRSVEELFPRVPHQQGEAILELDGIGGWRVPTGVNLKLRRGEILGISGLVGAGRTELLRTVFGLDPVIKGRVKVRAISPGIGPKGRIRAGMGMVSEDRKGEGLAQTLSVADNLTLSRLNPYSLAGVLSLSRRDRAAQTWMQTLSVKARSPYQDVGTLSGGNQQKVALARVLHQEADVLLLDEPTRGIDIGTKSEIYRLIGELAAAGKAVIFVSSYLPELLAICDTIGVMARGQLREVRPVDQWTEESVMAAAVGGEA